jgi:hypothetical protein
LKEAIEDWTTQIEGRRQSQDLVPDEAMHWQLYDLLGYDGLTPEIVEYLMALLTESTAFDPVRLFHRLEDFYLRWCDGEFIDELDSENLPQKKLRSLRDQVQETGGASGLRQVDVYTGLNVMILLFELHRYGRSREELEGAIEFHPCGRPGTTNFDLNRLLRIVDYSDSVDFQRQGSRLLFDFAHSNTYYSFQDFKDGWVGSLGFNLQGVSGIKMSMFLAGQRQEASWNLHLINSEEQNSYPFLNVQLQEDDIQFIQLSLQIFLDN